MSEQRPLVTRGWIASFGIMYLGVNIAWAAPSQLLIANQLLAWHPAEKEARLAFIMALGGFLGLIAGPLVGIFSDKTRSRLGRRAPWIIIGSIGSASTLLAMAFAPGYVWLVVGWCIFQMLVAAPVTASQAIPPDRVNHSQYGVVSGVMGISWTMALVVGTLLGESLSIKAAYIASAALMILLCLPYLVKHNQTSLNTQPTEGAFAGAIMEAEAAGGLTTKEATGIAAYRDFAWVFISRLAATLGNTVALFYLLYFLRDQIKLEDPDLGVLQLTVIYAVVVVFASIISGKASDKVGRRKPFVLFSCLGIAAACLLMAWATNYTIVIIAAIILGASWGIFTAIDQALINQVLPSASSRGRDIGIMAIAVATPNLASPMLAAFALLVLGGYPGLYVMSASLAVIGGISVMMVRGSR